MAQLRQTWSIASLSEADGIDDALRQDVATMANVYMDNYSRNQRLVDYYEDRHIAADARKTLPKRFKRSSLAIGWAAKGVNMLADRSILDRFAFTDGSGADMSGVLDLDELRYQYSLARRTQLMFGCGFWTLTKGGAGEPPVVVAFHDLLSSAALWDWSKRRVKLGMAIEDWYDDGRQMQPRVVCVYADGVTMQLEYDKSGGWSVTEVEETGIGRPAMVAMPFQPTTSKPFGRSRISRRVMELTDEMQVETANTMLHSELFSSPRRYILGLDSQAKMNKSPIELYMDQMLTITRDRQGNVPEVGEFSQASMEPHVSYMEFLARQMSAETDLPVAAFGVSSNGYTSSEALRASTDDLIMAAESMNITNGRAMTNVAVTACAIAAGKPVENLDESVFGIVPRFVDPSMPSLSARADAMVKKASAIPWLAETSVALEDLGYDKATQSLLAAERDQAEMRQATNSIFGAVSGE